MWLIRPRSRSFPAVSALICLIFLSPTSPLALCAQTTSSSERSQGISFYEQGDDLAAIKLLKVAVKRNKTDLGAWHYLGLALERQGKRSDARKAHEKAARLGDGLLEARFLNIRSGNTRVPLEDIHEPLSQAAESAQKFIALSSNLAGSKRDDWNDRVEYLRSFAEQSDPKSGASGPPQIFSGKEVTTKARVLSKPEPGYTEEARKYQVIGTVVLRAVFAADGQVKGIFPVKALPHGLTRMAINAARRIRFVPAMKDGKPVSTFMQLEYSFNLY